MELNYKEMLKINVHQQSSSNEYSGQGLHELWTPLTGRNNALTCLRSSRAIVQHGIICIR